MPANTWSRQGSRSGSRPGSSSGSRPGSSSGSRPGTSHGPRSAGGEDFGDSIERLRRLRRLSGIARLMDTAIGIPGTRIRFGADSVLGLVPLVGDAGGALVGLYIVNEARRMGMPAEKLAQMVGNIALDSVVGSVPVLGDLFDVYFKSHRRNVDMILDHFGVMPEDLRRER